MTDQQKKFDQLCVDVAEMKAALIGNVAGKRGLFERVRRLEWVVGVVLSVALTVGTAYFMHTYLGIG